MRIRIVCLLCLIMLAPLHGLAQHTNIDAKAIVKAALDHWRGESSYSEMRMIIHRPDWQREMAMRSWTQGSTHSLVRITAPNKDAGTATLLIDGEMWTFAPKINRIIKIPSAMMSQSWMGSDFSNNDIAKAEEIVNQYEHTLLAQRQQDGMTVYEIEARPHDDAAVVWGKEILTVRDDYLLLSHAFYDQSGVLVKTLQTTKIEQMGGRLMPAIQRVTQADKPEEWTEVQLTQVRFDEPMPSWLFTQSNLRNPRQ